MMRRVAVLVSLVLFAGCGNNTPPVALPAAEAGRDRSATPELLDSLWAQVQQAVERRKWDQVASLVGRFNLEVPPGDARATRARLYTGEAYLGKKEYLQAAREFRRVSDENPADSLAPEGLLRVGDSYMGLWRRPELDPTYGQAALATYQELLSRYPDSDAANQAQLRIADLNDRFAYKQLKAAQYYLRNKAYDSAILYLKDVAASYPRAKVTPEALVLLIRAYRALNYQEDVQETCEYLRKYHPDRVDGQKTCAGVRAPADSAAPAPLPLPPPPPPS